MSTFNGKAENIENNLNKVKSITPASTDNQYPSAKAVYDFAKKDNIYNPESENAQTGKAVAQAMSHFDTILKSGNTFIFDGGRPSGKTDIDLAVDDTLDPQSQNPLQNDTVTEEFRKVEKNIQTNASEIKGLLEQISKIILEYIPSEDADNRYLKFDDVADYPIEIGEIHSWTYRRWKSGFIELRKKTKITIDISEKHGESYMSSVSFSEPFPCEFIEPPVCLPTATSNLNNWPLSTKVGFDATTLASSTIWVSSITEIIGAPISINWEVKGYLKTEE